MGGQLKEKVDRLREASEKYCWGFVFHDFERYMTYVNQGDLVLEVGCHKQMLKPHIEARGAQYIGVDICIYGVKIEAICDGHQLPFRDQVFNKLYAIHVIEHLENPFTFLKECRRVLKHGTGMWGHMILQLPALDMEDETHLYVFNPESIRRLTELAGFMQVVVDINAPNIMTVVAW